MNLFHLKSALLTLLLLWQTPPQPVQPSSHFKYQRAITLPPPPPSNSIRTQACAILDANVFAHAAPALKDLRLYSGLTEIPYATTISEPPQQDTDDARILNLRTSPTGESRRILLDLEMPRRPYTSLVLGLVPHDFIATATVSGSTTPDPVGATPLGSFTLFDLNSQQLSRSLSIPLPESTYPYLHLQLALVPASGSLASSASLNATSTITAVTVPPSREAQSLYVTTQQAPSALQQGQESVYSFDLPARIPVERIAFALPPGNKQDFSRDVRIEARGLSSDPSQAIDGTADSASFKQEAIAGSIFQVHKSEDGHDLTAESLDIPVAIGSNMQQAARVEVDIDNRKEAPLPLTVSLQMRQRRICFDSALATSSIKLYYGDPSLEAPNYKAASLNFAATSPRTATLDTEVINVDFTAGPTTRKLTQRPPILRWIAILGCICIFALLVIRRNHRRQR